MDGNGFINDEKRMKDKEKSIEQNININEVKQENTFPTINALDYGHEQKKEAPVYSKKAVTGKLNVLMKKKEDTVLKQEEVNELKNKKPEEEVLSPAEEEKRKKMDKVRTFALKVAEKFLDKWAEKFKSGAEAQPLNIVIKGVEGLVNATTIAAMTINGWIKQKYTDPDVKNKLTKSVHFRLLETNPSQEVKEGDTEPKLDMDTSALAHMQPKELGAKVKASEELPLGELGDSLSTTVVYSLTKNKEGIKTIAMANTKKIVLTDDDVPSDVLFKLELNNKDGIYYVDKSGNVTNLLAEDAGKKIEVLKETDKEKYSQLASVLGIFASKHTEEAKEGANNGDANENQQLIDLANAGIELKDDKKEEAKKEEKKVDGQINTDKEKDEENVENLQENEEQQIEMQEDNQQENQAEEKKKEKPKSARELRREKAEEIEAYRGKAAARLFMEREKLKEESKLMKDRLSLYKKAGEEPNSEYSMVDTAMKDLQALMNAPDANYAEIRTLAFRLKTAASAYKNNRTGGFFKKLFKGPWKEASKERLNIVESAMGYAQRAMNMANEQYRLDEEERQREEARKNLEDRLNELKTKAAAVPNVKLSVHKEDELLSLLTNHIDYLKAKEVAAKEGATIEEINKAFDSLVVYKNDYMNAASMLRAAKKKDGKLVYEEKDRIEKANKEIDSELSEQAKELSTMIEDYRKKMGKGQQEEFDAWVNAMLKEYGYIVSNGHMAMEDILAKAKNTKDTYEKVAKKIHEGVSSLDDSILELRAKSRELVEKDLDEKIEAVEKAVSPSVILKLHKLLAEVNKKPEINAIKLTKEERAKRAEEIKASIKQLTNFKKSLSRQGSLSNNNEESNKSRSKAVARTKLKMDNALENLGNVFDIYNSLWTEDKEILKDKADSVYAKALEFYNIKDSIKAWEKDPKVFVRMIEESVKELESEHLYTTVIDDMQAKTASMKEMVKPAIILKIAEATRKKNLLEESLSEEMSLAKRVEKYKELTELVAEIDKMKADKEYTNLLAEDKKEEREGLIASSYKDIDGVLKEIKALRDKTKDFSQENQDNLKEILERTDSETDYYQDIITVLSAWKEDKDVLDAHMNNMKDGIESEKSKQNVAIVNGIKEDLAEKTQTIKGIRVPTVFFRIRRMGNDLSDFEKNLPQDIKAKHDMIPTLTKALEKINLFTMGDDYRFFMKMMDKDRRNLTDDASQKIAAKVTEIEKLHDDYKEFIDNDENGLQAEYEKINILKDKYVNVTGKMESWANGKSSIFADELKDIQQKIRKYRDDWQKETNKAVEDSLKSINDTLKGGLDYPIIMDVMKIEREYNLLNEEKENADTPELKKAVLEKLNTFKVKVAAFKDNDELKALSGVNFIKRGGTREKFNKAISDAKNIEDTAFELKDLSEAEQAKFGDKYKEVEKLYKDYNAIKPALKAWCENDGEGVFLARVGEIGRELGDMITDLNNDLNPVQEERGEVERNPVEVPLEGREVGNVENREEGNIENHEEDQEGNIEDNQERNQVEVGEGNHEEERPVNDAEEERIEIRDNQDGNLDGINAGVQEDNPNEQNLEGQEGDQVELNVRRQGNQNLEGQERNPNVVNPEEQNREENVDHVNDNLQQQEIVRNRQVNINPNEGNPDVPGQENAQENAQRNKKKAKTTDDLKPNDGDVMDELEIGKIVRKRRAEDDEVSQRIRQEKKTEYVTNRREQREREERKNTEKINSVREGLEGKPDQLRSKLDPIFIKQIVDLQKDILDKRNEPANSNETIEQKRVKVNTLNQTKTGLNEMRQRLNNMNLAEDSGKRISEINNILGQLNEICNKYDELKDEDKEPLREGYDRAKDIIMAYESIAPSLDVYKVNSSVFSISIENIAANIDAMLKPLNQAIQVEEQRLEEERKHREAVNRAISALNGNPADMKQEFEPSIVQDLLKMSRDIQTLLAQDNDAPGNLVDSKNKMQILQNALKSIQAMQTRLDGYQMNGKKLSKVDGKERTRRFNSVGWYVNNIKNAQAFYNGLSKAEKEQHKAVYDSSMQTLEQYNVEFMSTIEKWKNDSNAFDNILKSVKESVETKHKAHKEFVDAEEARIAHVELVNNVTDNLNTKPDEIRAMVKPPIVLTLQDLLKEMTALNKAALSDTTIDQKKVRQGELMAAAERLRKLKDAVGNLSNMNDAERRNLVDTTVNNMSSSLNILNESCNKYENSLSKEEKQGLAEKYAQSKFAIEEYTSAKDKIAQWKNDSKYFDNMFEQIRQLVAEPYKANNTAIKAVEEENRRLEAKRQREYDKVKVWPQKFSDELRKKTGDKHIYFNKILKHEAVECGNANTPAKFKIGKHMELAGGKQYKVTDGAHNLLLMTGYQMIEGSVETIYKKVTNESATSTSDMVGLLNNVIKRKGLQIKTTSVNSKNSKAVLANLKKKLDIYNYYNLNGTQITQVNRDRRPVVIEVFDKKNNLALSATVYGYGYTEDPKNKAFLLHGFRKDEQINSAKLDLEAMVKAGYKVNIMQVAQLENKEGGQKRENARPVQFEDTKVQNMYDKNQEYIEQQNTAFQEAMDESNTVIDNYMKQAKMLFNMGDDQAPMRYIVEQYGEDEAKLNANIKATRDDIEKIKNQYGSRVTKYPEEVRQEYRELNKLLNNLEAYKKDKDSYINIYAAKSDDGEDELDV